MINYLNYYQEIFLATFKLVRAKYDHRGNKGSCNENIIREFLREVMPDSLKIGHGEVIDSYGLHSKQTDIVVVDGTLQPFIKDKDYMAIPNLFIIDAVTCAGEVKAILDDKSLRDSLDNGRTFKLLSSKYSNGSIRCTNHHDAVRFYDKKPFFIFAFESNISTDRVHKVVKEYYQNSDIPSQIDGIFILDKGAIINFGDGQGALTFINKETNKSVPGFVFCCDQNKVIERFISWIFAVMPRMLTLQNPIMHYLPLN